jgi:hypothetical protein
VVRGNTFDKNSELSYDKNMETLKVIKTVQEHPLSSSKQQAKAMKQFFKKWNGIKDEPLGAKFDEAISSSWKFNEVDFS